jgi:hypothetical protein
MRYFARPVQHSLAAAGDHGQRTGSPTIAFLAAGVVFHIPRQRAANFDSSAQFGSPSGDACGSRRGWRQGEDGSRRADCLLARSACSVVMPSRRSLRSRWRRSCWACFPCDTGWRSGPRAVARPTPARGLRAPVVRGRTADQPRDHGRSFARVHVLKDLRLERHPQLTLGLAALVSMSSRFGDVRRHVLGHDLLARGAVSLVPPVTRLFSGRRRSSGLRGTATVRPTEVAITAL